jgi:hypothetical protein
MTLTSLVSAAALQHWVDLYHCAMVIWKPGTDFELAVPLPSL